ncbi:MAG: hypothetical protein NTW61_06660 [Candidatus Melainabacteria bacterium]|nr:hypothetical protein [Candidatus Melainabacteria bacterium]
MILRYLIFELVLHLHSGGHIAPPLQRDIACHKQEPAIVFLGQRRVL